MSTTTPAFRPLDDLGPYLFGDGWAAAASARWVESAWGRLATARVVPERPAAGHGNYPDHLVTAAALIHLAAVFAEEGQECSVEPPMILGAAPLISELALGRHAEHCGLRSPAAPESAEELAALAVRRRMPAVARGLVAEMGVARLFADLWVASHPAELDLWRPVGDADRSRLSFPVPDEVAFQVLNGLSVSKMITFEWLNQLAPDRWTST